MRVLVFSEKFIGKPVDISHIYLYDEFHQLTILGNKEMFAAVINTVKTTANAIKNSQAGLSTADWITKV